MKRRSHEFNQPVALDRRAVCQALMAMTSAAIWAPMPILAQPKADAVAQTRAGKVRGVTQGPVKVFKGVPYGSNTAQHRFMKATAPQPWSGERDATKYGPQTPQGDRAAGGARALLKSWYIPQENSEDCLVLNVWTPGLRDGRKRPVMLYIHGGGYTYGSGAAEGYDGARLAQRGDVVVITVNHRLNVFGYLYLGQLGGEQYADSGNVGQHDLILALQWVRENIEEFGGDPNNVLLFGESGGGMKICTLLAMPQAQGLFHRAVAQSGQMVWGANPDEATETAREVLKMVGVAPTNLRAVNDVSMKQWMDAFAKLPAKYSVKLAPVVDGRGLQRHPFDPDAPAMSSNVPLMIGLTKTETTFVFGGPEFFTLTWEDLPVRLKPFLGSLDGKQVVAQYRKVLPQASPSDVFFAATTHLMMTRNVHTIADRKAALKAAPVYGYELVWETPADGGKWRSPHTLDIALAFDNVAKSPSMFGGTPPAAQRLADQMSEAWIAFARKGDPNNALLPKWPAYDPVNRATMMFDTTSKVMNNPRDAEVAVVAAAPAWNATKASL